MRSAKLTCLLFSIPFPALAAGSEVVGENLLWLALILMAARLFALLANTLDRRRLLSSSRWHPRYRQNASHREIEPSGPCKLPVTG